MQAVRRLLMVYPQFFPTYWGMQYAMELTGQKALMPPLGLLTIAALTPPEYEIKLVDLNCEPLTDAAIDWADAVLFSAMLPQKPALFEVAQRCRRAGKLIVFGGPFPTACAEECEPYCDVLVLNEGEVTWPMFLKDLELGAVQKRYTSEDKPDVTKSPCPRFDLARLSDYSVLPIQYSRGCPFQCEFCDIIVMFGRRPRTKTPEQVLVELDTAYQLGYRGVVFIVDDNFIGNKKEVKKLLPALEAWNQAHGRPFVFGTEASVNLADDEPLMRAMHEADFWWVFLGIETPSTESLKETRKLQNTKGSLVEAIQRVQQSGMMVYAGFIIGFDADGEDIFQRQIDFITQAAVPNAMIGPLVALPGTPLYKRMQDEGRLLDEKGPRDRTVASGYTNIVTKLPQADLLAGQRQILSSIYTPTAYLQRAETAFFLMPRRETWRGRLADLRFHVRQSQQFAHRTPLGLVLKVLLKLPPEMRRQSLRMLRRMLFERPEFIPYAFAVMVMCYHFYRFTFDDVVPKLDRDIEELSQVA